MGYGLAEVAQQCTPRMQSIRERLTERKTVLERQLEEVNVAIKMLDENPAFEKVQDAIQRAGY